MKYQYIGARLVATHGEADQGSPTLNRVCTDFPDLLAELRTSHKPTCSVSEVERGEGWDPEFRIREFAVFDPFDARARSKDVLLLFPLRITLPRSRTATGTTVVAGNQ